MTDTVTMYRANTSGSVEVDGVEFTFRKDELYAPDHQVVKACPLFFDPAEDAVRPAVEAATAAPGAKRGKG